MMTPDKQIALETPGNLPRGAAVILFSWTTGAILLVDIMQNGLGARIEAMPSAEATQ
jgi:hypothetical protein